MDRNRVILTSFNVFQMNAAEWSGIAGGRLCSSSYGAPLMGTRPRQSEATAGIPQPQPALLTNLFRHGG
jgi:hypothetical protein